MNILEALNWLIKNPDKKMKEMHNGKTYYLWFNGQGYLRRTYIDSVGEVSFTGYTASGNWEPISWEEDEQVIKYTKRINEIKEDYSRGVKYYEQLLNDLKPMSIE